MRHPLFLTLPLLSFLLLVSCEKPSDTLVVSGRIEVDNVHIGSKIGGRISEVRFDESESVKAGDVVVLLEDQEIQAQIREARAAQAQAQAQLDLLLAGSRKEDIERAQAIVQARRADLDLRKKGFRAEEVRGAEAQLAQARSNLELAEKEYQRADALLKSRTIGQEEMDRSRASLLETRAQVEVREQSLALFRSGSRPEEIAATEAQLAQAEAELRRLESGARPEEIAAQRAALEQAGANVARLQTQLEETRILSPSEAMVETLELKKGDLVRAGVPVAVLDLLTQPWVRCYVPENRLGFVKPGEEVEVAVDSFPGERFRGKIRRVAGEAEFTPRNVQTSEKRSELVFEMKVDIVEKGTRLRMGMYADVFVPLARPKP